MSRPTIGKPKGFGFEFIGQKCQKKTPQKKRTAVESTDSFLPFQPPIHLTKAGLGRSNRVANTTQEPVVGETWINDDLRQVMALRIVASIYPLYIVASSINGGCFFDGIFSSRDMLARLTTKCTLRKVSRPDLPRIPSEITKIFFFPEQPLVTSLYIYIKYRVNCICEGGASG